MTEDPKSVRRHDDDLTAITAYQIEQVEALTKGRKEPPGTFYKQVFATFRNDRNRGLHLAERNAPPLNSRPQQRRDWFREIEWIRLIKRYLVLLHCSYKLSIEATP